MILHAAPVLDQVSFPVHFRNREDANQTCMLWLDNNLL